MWLLTMGGLGVPRVEILEVDRITEVMIFTKPRGQFSKYGWVSMFDTKELAEEFRDKYLKPLLDEMENLRQQEKDAKEQAVHLIKQHKFTAHGWRS